MLTTSLFLPGLIATLTAIAYGALRLPLTELRYTAPTSRPRPVEESPMDTTQRTPSHDVSVASR